MARKRKGESRRLVDEWQITCLKKQKEDKKDFRDWAGLHDYLLEGVLERLPLADCLTFATVCKPWRHISSRFLGECDRGVPCFVKRGQFEVISRSCYNILENSNFEMELPDAYGRCIWGSIQDWLFLGKREKSRLYISLLNPFSGENIHLPKTSPDYYLMVVSAVPDEKYICMLVGERGMVAFWTPGARQWHEIRISQPLITPLDALYYQGRFYLLYKENAIVIINEKNVINMLDTESDESEATVFYETRSISLPNFQESRLARHYLVESCGEIILVYRSFFFNDEQTLETSSFATYRLDFHNMAWSKMENLKDQILFVGSCCSRSFHSKELGDALASNVYFINEGRNVFLNEWNPYYQLLRYKNDGDNWGVFSFQKANHWPSVFQENPNRLAGVWLTAPISWCLEQRGVFN